MARVSHVSRKSSYVQTRFMDGKQSVYCCFIFVPFLQTWIVSGASVGIGMEPKGWSRRVILMMRPSAVL